MSTIWCRRDDRYKAFLNCPKCDDYPCRHLTAEELQSLMQSPLLRAVNVTFLVRRKTMYLIKYYDGTSEEVAELDTKNPDAEKMRNVQEVLVIKQVLVPKVQLVPKTAEEKAKVVKTAAKATAAEAGAKEAIAAVTKKPRAKRKAA